MSSRAAALRTGRTALPVSAWPVLAPARLADSAMYLHELFHDGRHLLGVPCH